MALPEEYRVTRKVGFNGPNIAYFVSRSVSIDEFCLLTANLPSPSARLGTLGCVYSTSVFRSNSLSQIRAVDWLTWLTVASIDNCKSLKYVQGAFFVIGGPATSLLFFFRVRAVYNHSKIVTVFFGFS
jgi:hypothetical protein